MNYRALFVFRPLQMIPRHVPALALGTLALGVAEFSMIPNSRGLALNPF